MAKQSLISVIIPAFNEEKSLHNILDSLVAQKTNYNFEVILVDNNSHDKTAAVAQSYKSKLDLKIIFEKKQGRGCARYTGFESSTNTYLFSTDADTIVPENWIQTYSDYLIKQKKEAVTSVCFFKHKRFSVRVLLNLALPIIIRLHKLAFGHYWLSGFSFAITKDAYIRSGGFNKDYNTNEDVDLGFKVARVAKIHFVPEIVVECSARRFDKGLIQGLYPYLKNFYEYFVHKKNVILEDVR